MRGRHRDGDRSLRKHRNLTSSSSTYALAPVYCADSQQTTTSEMSGLTVVPQSPSKSRTLPPRVGSPRVGLPSPRTCRRLQIVGYSPATMRQFTVGGGVDALTMPRFNDLDVWKTAHGHDDLSVLHPHSVWSDTDLPPPPPPQPASTWQRCSCSAGPPPCMTTPCRVRRPVPPPSPTLATSPMSFSTFKPSPAISPAGVETTCPITLRPERCGGDDEQSATRPPQSCHGMSLHLHVKHGMQCQDSSNRSEQSTT